MRQTIEYAASVGLVFGALRQLKEGIQYVSDLNKELVNIQVLQQTGAQTNEEIAQLAVGFNDLARGMGATTIEVAKGSTEWLRQGKSIAETQELLKSTLMLSKLGNLDTAQSTEYLTAIVNGFKLSASDATTVVDKLIAIDNIAATSAGREFARTCSNT
jgi:TP901 family phage tail tape measure protein